MYLCYVIFRLLGSNCIFSGQFINWIPALGSTDIAQVLEIIYYTLSYVVLCMLMQFSPLDTCNGHNHQMQMYLIWCIFCLLSSNYVSFSYILFNFQIQEKSYCIDVTMSSKANVSTGNVVGRGHITVEPNLLGLLATVPVLVIIQDLITPRSVVQAHVCT